MKGVSQLVGVVVLALIAAGCATSHTTLVRPDLGGGQVIYQISEEKAFTTALEAYAVFLPKQSVDDVVDGLRRGYSADERWGLDYWTHRTLVIPAVGTDASGNEVRGYWYDISGSGTLIPVGENRTRFLRFILSRLDGTGTATLVTNLRDGSYETDGRAYLGLKRDARDIKLGSRSPDAGKAERLGELKTLRDKGLITEEEYQAKRRQILDRM
jgi:hypothetical protein